MGANAQTSVPLYVAAEVLTAANMNISAGTGVPVFATTVTRDAAFGGAGKKVLAEGQLAYIEASDVVQYYTGAAWATVGPASAGALVFINGTTFTTQTTVSMAAGTFTSTYKNYLVILDHQPGGSGGAEITYRFNVAGSPQTGANYYGSKSFISSAGTQTLTGASTATSLPMGQSGGTTGGGGTMTVYNPVSATTMTDVGGVWSAQGGGTFAGMYEVNEAHDGLTFIFATSSTGFYRVYGLADS